MLICRSVARNRVRASERAITLTVSHAPIAVRDVVLNSPPALADGAESVRNARAVSQSPASPFISSNTASITIRTRPGRRVNEN